MKKIGFSLFLAPPYPYAGSSFLLPPHPHIVLWGWWILRGELLPLDKARDRRELLQSLHPDTAPFQLGDFKH
jgi:hypothetical protein